MFLDVIDESGLCEKYAGDIDKLIESHSSKQIEIGVIFLIKQYLKINTF